MVCARRRDGGRLLGCRWPAARSHPATPRHGRRTVRCPAGDDTGAGQSAHICSSMSVIIACSVSGPPSLVTYTDTDRVPSWVMPAQAR